MILLIDCGGEPPSMPRAQRATRDVPQTALLRTVQFLPAAATTAQIAREVPAIIEGLGQSTRRDRAIVEKALESLSSQPNAVLGLEAGLQTIPKEQYQRRFAVVQILGALRRTDAMPVLQRIATAPLPARKSDTEGLGPREREEILQGKAIQGVQFLRNPQGNNLPEADAFTLQLIRTHASKYVRVTALDAYSWNHGDTPAVKAFLTARIPHDLKAFVDRARFVRGGSLAAFHRAVQRKAKP